jgi:hypothetical protein
MNLRVGLTVAFVVFAIVLQRSKAQEQLGVAAVTAVTKASSHALDAINVSFACSCLMVASKHISYAFLAPSHFKM